MDLANLKRETRTDKKTIQSLIALKLIHFLQVFIKKQKNNYGVRGKGGGGMFFTCYQKTVKIRGFEYSHVKLVIASGNLRDSLFIV